MKPKFARWAARVAIVGWACIASLPAPAQLLPPPPLPIGSLIVTITSPASGSTVSGTVPVNASVSIVGSLTVANVDFFADGNFIGGDSASPYSVFWNTKTVGNGSHTLTAVARDLLGLTFSSNPVTVTVFNDSTRPTVTVNKASTQADPTSASPINFTVVFSEAVSGFSGTDVTVGGTAGGTKTVSVTGGPSTYTAAVSGMSSSGTVIATIAAGVASDAAGNTNTVSTSTDNSVQFNLPDTTRPTVTINQAANQPDPTSASPINFTVVFSEPVSGFTGTDVSMGGTAGGAKTVTVTGGPGIYNAAVSGMSSSGTVIATIAAGVASDAAGNTNTASTSSDNTVTFNLPDTTAPTVTVTSPATGATVSDSIPVRADAEDNVGVVGVRFFVNNTVEIGTGDTTAPYEVSWDTTTVANGSHILSAVARDAAGNTAASPGISVTVSNASPPDSTPPSVTITSPSGGSTVSDTVTVSANATDDVGVAGVRFFVGATEIGVEDTAAPYEVLWDTTTFADGSHTLTAIARDAAGNTTTSAGVAVTVANSGTAVTRVEAESNGDGFVGTGWQECTSAEATFSGGIAGCSQEPGNTYTLTFTGTAISWIGLRCNVCGTATVSIDGSPPGTVDTAAAAAPGSPGLASEVVFTASGLAGGTHTLVITVTGNTTSGGAFIVVDAFDITGGTASTTTRIEETDPAISKIGRWEVFFDDRASSGRLEEAFDAGARATLSFTGTAVSWIGARGDFGGIANVFLDGVLQGQVDTYCDCGTGTPRAEAQVVMFTASFGQAGSHTLTIEATGTKNPAAVNPTTGIIVDAFDVTP